MAVSKSIVESIKQKPERPVPLQSLPDFRNLGVLLRLLILVNLLAAATILIREDDVRAFGDAAIVMAGVVELPLFLAVLVLFLLQPALHKLSFRSGTLAIVLVVVAVVMVVFPMLREGVSSAMWRWVAWAVGATLLSLAYFNYRSQRYSPALTEARLLALTARIRPHFLFNSLNGVLGVIRSDPRRAERALEELAELFRALMQDNRELVPLGAELGLCERYVDLEHLRLGERLKVRWELETCPRDALVPPLLLQPLVENAVYHGVEPAAEPDEVVVRIARVGPEVRISVENTLIDADRLQAGNRMALENIRERLMLFFDLEARLEVKRTNGLYRVSIRLPYRRKK